MSRHDSDPEQEALMADSVGLALLVLSPLRLLDALGLWSRPVTAVGVLDPCHQAAATDIPWLLLDRRACGDKFVERSLDVVDMPGRTGADRP
jgi:hypothetical protein